MKEWKLPETKSCRNGPFLELISSLTSAKKKTERNVHETKNFKPDSNLQQSFQRLKHF